MYKISYLALDRPIVAHYSYLRETTVKVFYKACLLLKWYCTWETALHSENDSNNIFHAIGGLCMYDSTEVALVSFYETEVNGVWE